MNINYITIIFSIIFLKSVLGMKDCHRYKTAIDLDISPNSLQDMIKLNSTDILLDCDGINLTFFGSFAGLTCSAFQKNFEAREIFIKKFRLRLYGAHLGIGLSKEDSWFWVGAEKNEPVSLSQLDGQRFNLFQIEGLGQGIGNFSGLTGDELLESSGARRSGGGWSGSIGFRTGRLKEISKKLHKCRY